MFAPDGAPFDSEVWAGGKAVGARASPRSCLQGDGDRSDIEAALGVRGPSDLRARRHRGRTVRCARAVRALCEKLAVLHHREFGKFRRLEGCH